MILVSLPRLDILAGDRRPRGLNRPVPDCLSGDTGNDPSLLEPPRRGAYDRTHRELGGREAGPGTPATGSRSPIDPRESRTMTDPRPCPFRWAGRPVILACLAVALPAGPRALGQA